MSYSNIAEFPAYSNLHDFPFFFFFLFFNAGSVVIGVAWPATGVLADAAAVDGITSVIGVSVISIPLATAHLCL